MPRPACAARDPRIALRVPHTNSLTLTLTRAADRKPPKKTGTEEIVLCALVFLCVLRPYAVGFGASGGA